MGCDRDQSGANRVRSGCRGVSRRCPWFNTGNARSCKPRNRCLHHGRLRRPPHVTGNFRIVRRVTSMRNEQSGLMASVAWHCWRLLSFRGDWRSMPDSSGLVWLVLGTSLFGGFAEQMVRGRTLASAIATTLAWLCFIILVSRINCVFNRRLATALGLLSVGIQMLLILSTWIPAAEWPVAIWSGIAVMHVLTQANNNRASSGVG